MDSIEEETRKKCGIIAPTFPLARFCYFGFYRAYYPFGNIPAEDFLENCAETLQPSVLVLGCGDIRSCFYTLWKNFDSSISNAPKKFESVCFTLNDYSAAILARNIIFLYLCLQLPEGNMEKGRWLSAMWAIWYCHELYPNHLEVLDASLRALLTFSESAEQWSSKDNPLCQLVQFTSSTCLSDVAEMWKMWLNKTVSVASVKNMHDSRNRLLSSMINDISEHSFNLSKGHTLVHGDENEVITRKAAARAPEVRSYLEVGSCYAEHVVGLDLPKKAQTKVNLTMYERQDGKYTCHYALVPFECYYHTMEFSPQLMKSKGVTIPYDVIVHSANFKSKPFLANSVQQFAMWIQSSSRILKGKKVTILFKFDCQDAISLCQQQMQQNMKCISHALSEEDEVTCRYDIITTSNLMDHISPSNLVLACVPLLNADGLMTITSLCCKNCTNTGEQFLDLCFGLNSQLFPVVLGIRCISHEGTDCSNSVMIKPSPPDISHMLKCLPHVRTFTWVKVSNAQNLVFSQLPCIEDGNITEALVNLVGSCAYALLNYGPGDSKGVLSRNGIETALAMLERFKCLSGKSTSDFSYWESLCSALKLVGRPFLHCLQTQILLHDIHAHLTITKEDCPLCQQKALDSTLGLFCANINLELINLGTPFFMAFVHRCLSVDPTFLQSEAQEGRDVYIFDCFDAIASEHTLQLKFFAPLVFVQKEYRLTVAMVHRTNQLNLLTTIFSVTLKYTQTPWTTYAFCQSESTSQPDSTQANALFGTVTSHICDGYRSETKISLSEATIEALSTAKLSIDRVSSREVKLHCSSLNFLLSLSYPINYDTLKLNVSKSKNFVAVFCQRQTYSLDEERPCFTVSPDHQLSIVPTKLNMRIMLSQSHMQMTREESQLLQMLHLTQVSSHLKVKRFLQVLFECAMSCSYFYNFPDKICLLVVNEILFDYQHKSPAIDLAFCFVNDFDRSDIVKKWESSTCSSNVRGLPLETAGLEILKEVLVYFSRRTNGTLLSAGSSSKYAVLQKFDLGQAFTRAVLYLLLCDPDIKLYGAGDFFGFTTSNYLPKTGGVCCACCDRLSFTAKKCGRCAQVNYCSKKCQTKHWKAHKSRCIPATKHHQSRNSSQSQCIFCKKKYETSEKSTSCACVGVQYCSTDCQKKHWPEHLKTCGSVKEICPKGQDQDLASTLQQTLAKCAFCSKALFKPHECSRCGEVQYCNPSCQMKHWSQHKTACNEVGKVERDNLKLADPRCSFCYQLHSCMKKCRKCGQVQYCDQDCQRKHWPEHKKVCNEYCTISREAEKKLPTQNKCSLCNKSQVYLRKCTRCGKVQYCNRDCQAKDWPEHKRMCMEETEVLSCDTDSALNSKYASNDPSLKCDHCKKLSDNVKKCTKCGTVQYCNRDCQTRHWPEHKKVCMEAKKVGSGSKCASSNSTQKCACCKKASFSLKKCIKCEIIQYCSQDCQQKHWPEHKKLCTYITEMKHEVRQPLSSCAFCGSTPNKLFACKKCGKVKYCGRECQSEHWKEHKAMCTH